MSKLPSIDRLREQRWDIVRELIAKHAQMVIDNTKMRVVIELDDDEVKPDHVVQS